MIESILIKNFLSIKETMEFKFVGTREKDKFNDSYSSWYEQCGDKKLSKLVFILGNNAAGKTNFINAVRTMRQLVVNKPTERDEPLEYMPFLLDSSSRFEVTTFGMVFYVDDNRYIYNVSYDEDIIHEESLSMSRKSRIITVYNRTYDDKKHLSKVEFYPECELPKDEQYLLQRQTTTNTSVLASFWAMNLSSRVLKDCYLFFRDKIGLDFGEDESLADILAKGSRQEQNRLKNDVLMFLSIINSNICDYKITEHKVSIPKGTRDKSGRFELFEDLPEMFMMSERVIRTITFYHQTDSGVFPLDEEMESDGTLSLIRLIAMTQTLISKGMTVFIDEQPAGIHEQALQYMISCYIRLSMDCQLIVAGQDTSFLSYDKLRRDSIRIFKKGPDGNTYIFKDGENKLFQRNTNIRNFVFGNSDLGEIDASLEEIILRYQETMAKKRKRGEL
jgi:AAA15 family ATPase/GTPase